MRILVLYYSLEGNTCYIAEKIAETVGADLQALKPIQEIKLNGFKVVRGGRQVVYGKRPQLEPLSLDPGEYDLVFVGTPVWAFTYAPALRTCFREHGQSGKVACFCTHEGGPGKCLDRMAKAMPTADVLGVLDIRQPVRSDENVSRVTAWAKEIVAAATE